MNQINRARVIIGGIVGGLVIFFVMGFANHICMGPMWKEWMASTGKVMDPVAAKHSLYLWCAQSILLGLTGTAIYAGIRPRFGPGHVTALRAGFLLWLAAYLAEFLNARALRFLPHHIVAGEAIAGLVAALLGTYIGAAIYKE